jgi:ATP-dependent Clp protease, protease subunit
VHLRSESPGRDDEADEPEAPVQPLAPGADRPDPWAALTRHSPYERLFERRIVFLRGPLQETTADDLVAQLLVLDEAGDDDVTLLIDSPGGDTFAMFAVHDTMATMRSPVNTRCVGLAASAGAFLLATGTGTRSATANSSIMLHQPWGGTGRRTAIDIAKQAEMFASTRRRMQAILAERTGQPYERVRRDVDRDFWLTADEAREYGVIDEVVGVTPAIPDAEDEATA